MAILLIRHGETRGNRDRVLQVPETPLNEQGLAQAARLARRMTEHPVTRLLSSDLARAHMTAQAISDQIGLPVETEPLLQERNFGDLRGRRYADLEEDPFGPGYCPPGGESWADFDARVDRAWECVCREANKTSEDLAVVTHGLVLHSMVSRILDRGEPTAGEEGGGLPLQFRNTAITIVEPVEPWRVKLLGCAAHLDEEGEGGAGVGISGL